MKLCNALTMMAVLPLSACFTFIDFDLGDGGGGTGPSSATASPTTGTGAGGSLPVGGAGGQGGASCDEAQVATDAHNCGKCGHDCEGGECIDAICHAVAFFEAESRISLIGVGGPNVVVMEQTSADVRFLKADAAPRTPSIATVSGSSLPASWNNLGSALAVDENGAAYYSPQTGTPTDRPVFVCDAPSVTCIPAFLVPEADVAKQRQLNGLVVRGDTIFAISPLTGKVWTAEVGASPAKVAFTITDNIESPLGNGYAIAFGASRVAIVATADPAIPVAPYFGVEAAEALIDTAGAADYLICEGIQSPWAQVRNVAVAGSGRAYARAFYDDGSTTKGATLRLGSGATPVFEGLDIEEPAEGAALGGIAADEDHVYFFGDLVGRHFFRCEDTAVPIATDCVILANDLTNVGPVAADGKYVFFADGATLYRAVK